MKYVKCGAEVFTCDLNPLAKKCSRCEAKAFLKPEGTSLYLCPSCFMNFCEEKVKKNVLALKMFSPEKDRVGVFLSGGKDSASLLAILRKVFPKLQLFGIYLNLGIRYYSEIAEATVRELCRMLEVPLQVINLPEIEGCGIDDFVFTSFKDKICSVCGIIKRHYFTKVARELDLTIVATGHHLDDTLSTMLSLFFNGDFLSLSRLKPVLLPLYPNQPKKVKPLYNLPERDIFHYALLAKLPLESCGCPHGEVTSIKRWKGWLNQMLEEDRTFKYRLLSIFNKKLLPLFPKDGEREEIFTPCQVCGEPTPSQTKICVKCRRLELLKRIQDRRLEFSSSEFMDYYQIKDQNIVLFDVRERSDYEQGTFPGAIWVNPKLVEAKDREWHKFFKKFRNRELFFFCYSGRLSYIFVLRLRKLGYKAFNIKDSENLLSKPLKGAIDG